MSQKLFCLGVALLFAFVTLNVASAEEAQAVAAGCPCVKAAACFPCAAPCTLGCGPVTYRCGLFGAIRPVVYAPVYRPVVVPVYRPVVYPRYLRVPYCAPAPVCW